VCGGAVIGYARHGVLQAEGKREGGIRMFINANTGRATATVGTGVLHRRPRRMLGLWYARHVTTRTVTGNPANASPHNRRMGIRPADGEGERCMLVEGGMGTAAAVRRNKGNG